MDVSGESGKIEEGFLLLPLHSLLSHTFFPILPTNKIAIHTHIVFWKNLLVGNKEKKKCVKS